MTVQAGAGRVEQTSPGQREPAALVESFDGLGEGFEGPQGGATLRNPSDNSLAVGPDHIVAIVNSRMAIKQDRSVSLHQQGTYAPDGLFRWMASPAIDRNGNIGIGYSFGGTPHFAGQRFAGRLAADPPGSLTLRETVLIEGEAAQASTMRWEDYTQTAIDPSDDCTIWYVGDYLKKGATTYSSRIGAFRMPGCAAPAR
jgi:hypothetical protein